MDTDIPILLSISAIAFLYKGRGFLFPVTQHQRACLDTIRSLLNFSPISSCSRGVRLSHISGKALVSMTFFSFLCVCISLSTIFVGNSNCLQMQIKE